MILIIGPEVRDRSEVRDFGGVWSHYLTRELEARGVEVRHDKGSDNPAHFANMDLTGIVHVIAIGRYWSRVPAECAWILGDRIPGAIAQIHDRNRPVDPVSVTFTVVDDKRLAEGVNVFVGWAADKELCYPRKPEGRLSILVDHPNYGPGVRRDDSMRVLEDIKKMVKSEIWTLQYPHGVRVRRIVDGGVEKVDLAHLKVPAFNRQHIPFEVICSEYNRAHLFMVTHPESAGLTVLETAMAGALPVVPKDCISPALLGTVRHIVYDERVPWARVLKSIDVEASRREATKNSWARVAGRILHQLSKYA